MNALKEILELITKLLGIAGAMLGLATAVFGVYTYFRDSKRKLHIDTIEAYKKLQDEVFDKLNEWTDENAIADAVETADNVGYTQLSNSLAKIEHFCVGINRGVYDFETFYQMSHGYFDYKFKRIFRDLLDKKLNKFEDAEDYYNNLHKVWARMEERSKRPL